MCVAAFGTNESLSICAVAKGTILFEPSAATKSVFPSGENTTPCGFATLRSRTLVGVGPSSS
jgi:hypothetical protein